MTVDDCAVAQPIEANTRSFVAAQVIFARYVLFAAIAALSNLAAQGLNVRLLPTCGLSLGNWIKYLLDGHYVFGRKT